MNRAWTVLQSLTADIKVNQGNFIHFRRGDGMNLLKKTATGILVLALVLGACACSKRMSLDKISKVAEECGLEETGDEERLQKDVGAAQDYNEMVYYCSDKPKKAQKIYDIVFNRSNTYPAAEVTTAAFMYSNVINSNGDAVRENAYLFTFKSNKKANEFYEMLVRQMGVLQVVQGKDKYSYTLYLDHVDKYVIEQGMYVEGNTVIVVSGIGYNYNDFSMIDRLCKEMDILSPESAK